MMAAKFIIGLLVIFALLTFAVKNQQDVLVSYFFGYQISAKLWVAILASFAIGAVIASIGAGFSVMKLKSRNWSLARKMAKVEEELNSIKQKPMPDEPSVYPSPGNEPSRLPPPREVKSLPSGSALSQG